MKYKLFALLFFSFCSTQAQTYWQQKVDTRIEVRLDDKKHMLHGFEEITYYNNSPDTLRYIYFHLWPNAYKHDRTPFAKQQALHRHTDFYYAKPEQRGYIDSLNFNIDGDDADYFSATDIPDIARVDLRKPLLPGGKLKITTPFRVKIPVVFSRLGHTGQAYFMSQWFPKPAVYDKKGWHPISYLDQGEFYSEIGSYDVTITLPENYIVMATGNLATPKEQAWLDTLANAPLPPDTMYVRSFPKSSSETKTIQFKEDNIHDFAWFADKRWIVRKDTTTVPGTGAEVTTYTAFLPSYQRSWKAGNEYLKQTIKHYSQWVGPYPYKTIKAVQGDMDAGGGMEYPTVTVIDRSVGGSKDVIVHEAGHNWFYGILATNERDHAWMDEGFNTMYERKTVKATNKFSSSEDDDFSDIIYYQAAAAHKDQALEQTSANFTKLNYGGDVYFKTSLMLEWLEGYMGEQAFENAMHDYYNTWKHKHPYPEDYKAILQKHTDKPLDWFFDGALTTDRRIDYKITDAKNNSGKTIATVYNGSNITAPAGIAAYKNDSLIGKAWSQPIASKSSATIELPDSLSGWTRLKVAGDVPDGKTANNLYKKNGPFHRPGLGMGLGVGMNRKNIERTFVLPAVGYNVMDGFELGLLFHNLTWPENKFKYALAPMYSFGSKQPVGTGSVGYSFYPGSIFHEIMLQIDAKSFHYDKSDLNVTSPLYARYLKIAPAIHFTFKESSLLSTVTRRLTLKAYSVTEDGFMFNMNSIDSLFRPALVQENNMYGLLRYTHRNDRTFNPFSYSIEGQLGKDFAKINIEGNLRIDYHAAKKGLHIRGYLGKFFDFSTTPFGASRYYLNTTFTGANDYLYDDTYLGRVQQNGLNESQVSMREGAFKIPTPLYASPIGRSDNLLIALNLKTDLPLGKLPVRLFFDVGTFTNASKLNPSGSKILYDGGFEIHALQDVAALYVPVIMSRDFKDYLNTMHGKRAFVKSIVFTVNLHNINWLKLPAWAYKYVEDAM